MWGKLEKFATSMLMMFFKNNSDQIMSMDDPAGYRIS